jgi:flagellar motor switch protein FliN/FliY
MTKSHVIPQLLEHLRVTLSTTLDAPVTLAPGAMGVGGWRLTVAAATPVTIAVDADGAAALARALHPEAPVSAETITSALHELCSHAVAAAMPAVDGVAPDVHAPEETEWQPVPGEMVASLQCDALATPLIVAVAAGTSAGVSRADAAATRQRAADDSRFGVLLDIDLPLVVRFGCTDLPLKSLSRLGPGSVIDLSRAPDDPVEVLVGGRVVARGEVVVVSGSYGIRIVDIVGDQAATGA